MSYIQKTAEQIKTEIEQIFIKVFKNPSLSPSGIIGQLIEQLTQIGIDVENTKALLQSKILDPNFASGKELDAICAFHQITRLKPKPSIVVCAITGLANTFIPKDSIILNTNGNQFKLTTDITIPQNGNINATFNSIETGPISCTANTVNRILQKISGWDSVNNLNDGILGNNGETDTNLRKRRYLAININSSGRLRSIIAALENNNNVRDYNILENDTQFDQTIDNIIIPPKSMYLCVDIDSQYYNQIAEILNFKKSAGCLQIGNIQQEYTDPLYPWQTFIAKFDVAIPIQIYIAITVVNDNFTAETALTIKQAIYNNFYGIDGSDPVEMGKTFYAGRFYAPVSKLGIYQITSLTIGTSQSPTGTTITTLINQVARLELNNITVTII